jgi:hypothetical protein
MVRRFAPLAFGLVLVSVPISSASGTCPGYVQHLRQARVYLDRGERTSALAELRRAREELQACLRNDEGAVALAALADGPRRADATVPLRRALVGSL